MRRRGFTLIELLVVIAIIGILVAMLLPAVQAAREAARRVQCMNNTKQIALAIHSFAEAKGSLPPAALDCCHGTWMMSILPYIEGTNLYTQYKGLGTFGNANGASSPEKPFYFDPINLPVTTQRLSYATCPSDFENVVWIHSEHSLDVGLPPVDAALPLHNYGVNFGNTGMEWRRAWGSQSPIGAKDIYNDPRGPYGFLVAGKDPSKKMPDGSVYLGAPFEPRVEVAFATIRDGSSNTLLLSEFITAQQKEHKPSSHIDVRGLTWWGDGSGFTSYLPPNASAPDVTTFASYCLADIPGNPPCIEATDARVAVYYGARSQHPGGVVVSLCDGSVRFVADQIDLNLWRALSTIRGSEVLGGEF